METVHLGKKAISSWHQRASGQHVAHFCLSFSRLHHSHDWASISCRHLIYLTYAISGMTAKMWGKDYFFSWAALISPLTNYNKINCLQLSKSINGFGHFSSKNINNCLVLILTCEDFLILSFLIVTKGLQSIVKIIIRLSNYEDNC